MKFFESGRPPFGYGLCSDNSCPCPETRIPRGEGFLYVTPENLECRGDALSLEDWKRKKESMGGYLIFENGMAAPILVCEEGAIKRNLNLRIAAEDARHWWETGTVPFHM